MYTEVPLSSNDGDWAPVGPEIKTHYAQPSATCFHKISQFFLSILQRASQSHIFCKKKTVPPEREIFFLQNINAEEKGTLTLLTGIEFDIGEEQKRHTQNTRTKDLINCEKSKKCDEQNSLATFSFASWLHLIHLLLLFYSRSTVQWLSSSAFCKGYCTILNTQISESWQPPSICIYFYIVLIMC